jgi:hypothetical protein
LRSDTVPVIGYQDNGVGQHHSFLGFTITAVGVDLSYQDFCCPPLQFLRPRVDFIE